MKKGFLFVVAIVVACSGEPALSQTRRNPAKASEAPEKDVLILAAPTWDADHNGVYTCDEWKQYAARLFNMGDRNRDGYVDPGEFKIIQKAASVFANADLGYFGENGDTRVSRKEFVDKQSPFFARFDKNEDCKVTAVELNAVRARASRQAGQKGRRGQSGASPF